MKKKPIKIRFLIFIVLILSTAMSMAQQPPTPTYSLIDNIHPVTPTAFQFLKYTEMPVSEYTGMPNISVPLYEIKEDGISIPLSLTYHAGGLRVNEEASWVGLGWDMTVGSIVQQINDQDDLVASPVRPDYYNTGTPYMFPLKYEYCVYGGQFTCNYGCNGNLPVKTPIIADGLVIYTDSWAPFGGNYNTQQDYGFFNDHNYYNVDSEPDVFTVNVPGHSFKFIKNWDGGAPNYILLNAKGYQLNIANNTWTIISPQGDQYIFDQSQKTTVQSITNSQSFGGGAGGSSSVEQPSSNIWMLTKIITKSNKVITFNYTQTASQSCYPSFTQRGIISTLSSSVSSSNTADWTGNCIYGSVGSGGPGTSVLNTTNYSFEPYVYLRSINFPNGKINFSLSSRNDIIGGLKLDSLSITNNQLIKSYSFNYSYFDASNVGGNTYTMYGSTDFGNHPLYRLKLNSIQDNTGATHTFNYNSTQLPAKNSFAIDYWGFYNGAISNTTAVPNATQFNKSGWITNNDNHSANLTYAQACMLQQIIYPTGGSVNFNYELNQFNTYWVPDYLNSSNTISSGDGLRIQSVVWKDATSNQVKKTTYSYSGGMAAVPINYFRTYSYTVIPSGNLTPGTSGSSFGYKTYSLNESNMSGLFSPDPFSSFSGVGYAKVTKSDVDNNDNPNGTIVSYYYNNPDLVYNSASITAQIDPTLPAYKNPQDTAENGSLKAEYYYDANNNLLKKFTHTYTNIRSPLTYGARVMGYGSLVNYNNSDYSQTILPQLMVGYYPVYDFESLTMGTTETDYFGSDSVQRVTSYSYDNYNQISTSIVNNSTYSETNYYSYPYSANTSDPVLTAMVSANRLSDVVGFSKQTAKSTYYFTRTYGQQGNLFLASNDNIINNNSGGMGIPTITTYDKYDLSNGNVLQYTKNSLTNSFIYDYNKEYIIAEIKNAKYTNAAYTSFEADGTGRWEYTGLAIADTSAPTGKKVYSLSGGNISRDSLDATKTYIVSYWSKNGVQNVSGSSGYKQGYSFNGYTYYEHTIPAPANGTIIISGSGTIDELRLYPNDAQMTTYTFQPLVGVTSTSDAAGRISYYEYDNTQRLMNIRDQYGNILKQYCYNYAGQTTDCTVPRAEAKELSTVIYARIETDPIQTTTSGDSQNSTTIGTANVYIRFYSDANCTKPLTLSAALDVTVITTQEIDDDTGITDTKSNNIYHVASGQSSYSLGNLTIYNDHSYYDTDGTYHASDYSWSFDLEDTGTGYTPEATIYNNQLP